MVDRIELRTRDGRLLGCLVNRRSLEIQRGSVVYAVDLAATLASGTPVIDTFEVRVEEPQQMIVRLLRESCDGEATETGTKPA